MMDATAQICWGGAQKYSKIHDSDGSVRCSAKTSLDTLFFSIVQH